MTKAVWKAIVDVALTGQEITLDAVSRRCKRASANDIALDLHRLANQGLISRRPCGTIDLVDPRGL